MTELLDQYGLVALFAIVALQAMGVAGLPGKTALVTASILAADGYYAISHVIGITAIAATVGGYCGYVIGRVAGRRLISRPFIAKRVGKYLIRTEQFFAARGGPAVALARFFPGLKVVAAPTAGLVHMPWIRFAWWHALGAVGFALLFGLMGFFLGAAAVELVERYGVYALVPLVVVAAGAWLAWKRFRPLRLMTPTSPREAPATEQGEEEPRAVRTDRV